MAGALTGRGAVVTGAGRGIGAAVALALAGEGARVVIAARTASDLDAVIRAAGASAGALHAVACDVTDEAAVARLGEAARAHVGTVDILVNNAGAGASAPLAKITLADWNRLLATNATSTFLCTREFAPAMVERRWGRIVNVASVAGLKGARYIAHYAAAKHAVVGFTRAIAAELRRTGVTVNAVCPGYVDTPMTSHTLANVVARTGMSSERALAAVLEAAGQERLLTPGEVANAVLALCRDDAAGTTGQAIPVGAAGEFA